MRGRAGAALVLAIALLAAGAGCTDDAAGDDEAAPVDRPLRAPEVFGRPRPEGWSWVGATDDALVGLGGSPRGTGAEGQTVDLTTGSVQDLDPLPPVDGRAAEATAVAFRAEDVIVTGVLPPVGGYPPGTDRPPDVEAVSFRLDPEDGSWTVLDGPDLGLGVGIFARLELVGADVLGSFTHAWYRGTERARLVGDRWEVVRSEPPGGLPSDPACTSEGERWEAVRAEDGSWAGVLARSVGDGAERTIAVPGLRAPSIDPPQLGCAGDVVVVGQMEGAEAVAVLAATTDGGESWTDLTGRLPEGRVILGDVVSGGDAGVLVRAHLVEPGDDGEGDEGTSDASLVVARNGAAVPIDVDELSTPVVWRGGTGDLLALGPAPAGDPEISIRLLEIP